MQPTYCLNRSQVGGDELLLRIMNESEMLTRESIVVQGKILIESQILEQRYRNQALSKEQTDQSS